MAGIDRELLEAFLTESAERFETLDVALAGLEKDRASKALLDTIFRVAHTLKGDAACVGLGSLTASAHAVEDLLQGLRAGTVAVTPEIVTLLVRAFDDLRRMALSAGSPNAKERPDNPEVFARIAALATELAVTPSIPARPNVSASGSLAPRVRSGAPPHASSAPRVSSAPHASSAPRVSSAPGSTSLSPPRLSNRAPGELRRTATLRVTTDKLDRLMDLTAQAAIARARLGNLAAKLGGPLGTAVSEAYFDLERVSSELEDQLLRTRMVPIGRLLRQYGRTVREAMLATGKGAELVLEGEGVEVDTSVTELLRDPLTHMVRNAIDHGIESADVRRQQGKPERGRITLRAFHDGGSIVVEVSDDGAGFNRRRIGEKAEKLGWVRRAEQLSEADLFKLILRPGFSTAAKITELSGRGVGMDVVARNVEALRGSLHITSTDGVGSTITLRLPLSLAMIDGFDIQVAGETYVLPLSSVIECATLDPGSMLRGFDVFELQGTPLPCVRLRDLFGTVDQPPAERESVVVVEHRSGRACFVVDLLQGERKTVIKPLAGIFRHVPGVSASTILGDGRVALILDVPALLDHATKVFGNRRGENQGRGETAPFTAWET